MSKPKLHYYMIAILATPRARTVKRRGVVAGSIEEASSRVFDEWPYAKVIGWECLGVVNVISVTNM